MSHKMKRSIMAGFVCFCVLILALVVFMNIKAGNESRKLLEESIRSQLISITAAAREYIDLDRFEDYTSLEVARRDQTYAKTLGQIRVLAQSVGAEYIYVLREIDGQYKFIFDTDIIANASFEPYDLSEVHKEAFNGRPSAGIMNMQDEYGTFNTGAVPIVKNGQVIGIVCADIEDDFVQKSIKQFHFNMNLLIAVLLAMLALVGVVLFRLTSHLRKIQDEMARMANYDKLTDLPNRRYLLDHLDEITTRKKKTPFTLFFIDMDNFKKVNDTAGHDAGDALLQHVSLFLQNAHATSKVFRPGSGSLNVAARVGGDEFILVVQNVETIDDAQAFADELLNNFRNTEIDKYIEKYEVGLSIGAALFPYHTENYHVLIKYADMAMYHAKRAGKNCARVYTDDMEQKEEK